MTLGAEAYSHCGGLLVNLAVQTREDFAIRNGIDHFRKTDGALTEQESGLLAITRVDNGFCTPYIFFALRNENWTQVYLAAFRELALCCAGLPCA